MPTTRLTRGTRLLIQLFTTIIVGCAIVYIHLFVPGPGNGADFADFYAGAYTDAHGLDPFSSTALWGVEKYLYLGGDAYHGPIVVYTYKNPPPFALLLWPLTRMGLSAAYWIWATLMLLAGFIGTLLCLDGWPRRPRLLAACLAAISPASLWALHVGQNSSLLVLGLGLSLAALAGGRAAIAGAALSLGLMKPHLTLPIVAVTMLAAPRQDRLRMGLGFLAGIMVWVGIGLCFDGGWHAYQGWWTSLSADKHLLVTQGDVASFPGIYYHLVSETTSQWLNLVSIVLAVVIVLYCTAARGERESWNREHLLSTGIAACFTFLPYEHTSDQVLLALPLLILIGPDARGLRSIPLSCAVTACILAPLALFHDSRIVGINALPPMSLLLASLLALPPKVSSRIVPAFRR